MKKTLLTLTTAVALGLSSLYAYAADPIVIKFSHVVASDTPKGKAAEKFKALAEEKTDGAVKIEVYPNSTLYKDKEEMEALQMGAVQMLAPSLAKFGPLGVKEFEVFDLPYIFDSYDALHTVTKGDIGTSLLAKLEPKGVKGLAFWDNGFKVMSANKPLKVPDDYKGLKMRIQSSKVLEAQMRALGTNPQVLPFGETYQALQTGVVDGTENPPSNMYTQKMHEVQKNASVTNHGYLGYAVITNKAFWDKLPEDVRKGLEEAMAEATDYANAIAKEENDKALQAIKDSGKTDVYEPSDEELKVLKEKLMPVHEEMASRIGKDLIESIKTATAGVVEKAVEETKEVAKDAEAATKDVAKDTKDAAKDVADDVKEAAKDAEAATKDVAKDTKDAAKDVADDVKEAAKNTKDAIKDAANDDDASADDKKATAK